jgi:hypothetical protein
VGRDIEICGSHPEHLPGETKAEFLTRLSRCARLWSVEFSPARYDEWRKGGLVIDPRRHQLGRTPAYRYGVAQLRRCLWILRIYRSGIKDREAIILQLWLRQADVAPHQVREPLAIEFKKARNQCTAMVRSIFAERNGPITTGRRQALLQQFGDLHPAIAQTGFRLHPDDLIATYRLAVDPSRGGRPVERAGDYGAVINAFWPAFVGIFRGVLAKGEKDEPTSFEVRLARASDEELRISREVFLFVWPMLSILLARGHDNEDSGPSTYNSQLSNREWLPVLLAILISSIEMFEAVSRIDIIGDGAASWINLISPMILSGSGGMTGGMLAVLPGNAESGIEGPNP